VAQDIDQEGWSDVVVVAHSLGGLTALGLAAARPDRVRHIVFVSCVTPPPGTRPVDALAEPLRSYLSRRLTKAAATPDGTLQIPTWLARRFFCSDLDPIDQQLVLAQCVPDAPTVLLDRTPAAVLSPAITRTWVRLTKDRAIPPRVQDRMRANVDPATVVELSAGHDAMVSQPAALASIVARVGSRYL
jgi:pimeloyl-ACP methyl ester carboxylesterase